MTITTILIQEFDRYLTKLAEELNSYPNEAAIWKVADGISNSAGNLSLHLCGNLQYFIGAIMGETGYTRNRDAEFSLKNVQRQKLLDDIENTKAVITDTLEQVSKNELAKEFPFQPLGYPLTTEHFLIHLLSHFNYHLGQVNYHRRLVGLTVEAEAE